MKLKKVIEILEKEFPKELAFEWDNVGLLAGEENAEIKTVLVTLDVTPAVVEEAKTTGAELILSHHPIMFSGVKQVTDATTDGQILREAIKNNINIYAAHTNCDIAKNGINKYLADLFSLSQIKYLEENAPVRIGSLKKEMPAADFINEVKKKLSTPFVRVCGDTKSAVKKIAVGSGACADYIEKARRAGADLMVTADVKYHEMLEAREKGIIIVDAGHYPTEIVVMDIFHKQLLDSGLNIIKSGNEDVIKYI